MLVNLNSFGWLDLLVLRLLISAVFLLAILVQLLLIHVDLFAGNDLLKQIGEHLDAALLDQLICNGLLKGPKLRLNHRRHHFTLLVGLHQAARLWYDSQVVQYLSHHVRDELDLVLLNLLLELLQVLLYQLT